MRKKILFLVPAVLGMVASAVSLTACPGNRNKKDVYEDDKLVLNLRNLYFNDYSGGDIYLDMLEDQFKIKPKMSAYSWTDWMTQVNGAVNSDNVEDVFHANIDSYNFATYYKFWAEEEIAHQIPDDLSKWPNIKNLIDNTTNIDSLKIDGHLYGIPVAKNTTDFSTSYSPFTYVYRRDWAKEWGVYQENDEYTWEQFTNLLDVFTRKGKEGGGQRYGLGDVEWGFPSITNFYKQVPHCFAQDSTGKYVNNYTTAEYGQGLEMSKTFVNNKWYGYPQYSAADGDLNKEFYQNRCGVFYENLSYANFLTLRQNIKKTNAMDKNFNPDEAVGIMKIKGPDGKYVLEGTDNWFSMTFIDYKVSDVKFNKIMDLLDWLLSEEGTVFSVYGIEDYDYTKDPETGKISIVEKSWPKVDGKYTEKVNGAKYLRYMVSLGYDTYDYDPVTDKTTLEILNGWDAEMKTALNDNKLKVLKENAEVMWLTSPKKAQYSGALRTEALGNVTKFIYGDIKTLEEFNKSVTTSRWNEVLDEINTVLGK